jgi:hypothetical protein
MNTRMIKPLYIWKKSMRYPMNKAERMFGKAKTEYKS